MKSFAYLIENFFTHKDKLAPADQLPGTMFTPLHFAVAGIILAAVIVFAILIRKTKYIKPEEGIHPGKLSIFFRNQLPIRNIWKTSLCLSL